jgi:hypothetical protein
MSLKRVHQTILCLLGGFACLPASSVLADDTIPQRPDIVFNRWQEDWSVLADPRVPRLPFADLKYIRLSEVDPYAYLSFGADTRTRFEANNAALAQRGRA